MCSNSQASHQICGQMSPCAGSSALWQMYSNVWPNLNQMEGALQEASTQVTHSPGWFSRKEEICGPNSYVFLAHRGSLHSWWGWSVCTPEVPLWSSSSARAPPTVWPQIDFLSGRGSKQMLQNVTSWYSLVWVETVLVRSCYRWWAFLSKIHSNVSEIRCCRTYLTSKRAVAI